jgi:hypothetical protein
MYYMAHSVHIVLCYDKAYHRHVKFKHLEEALIAKPKSLLASPQSIQQFIPSDVRVGRVLCVSDLAAV